MVLFFLSLLAGALTVLAPCVLPLLPVVIAGSVEDARNKFAPLVIVASLGFSILVFTLVLKVSTAFIAVPPSFWGGVSGVILMLFGLITLFPSAWDVVALKFKLGRGSNKLLAEGYQKRNVTGDTMIGLALGPIFSTCSPTYAVILASVLPQNIWLGLLDLLAYVVGLSAVLLLIAFLGQRFVDKIAFASDPEGWFKKGLGLLFLLLGALIFFGVDKKIETSVVNSNFFDVTSVESQLLKMFNKPQTRVSLSTENAFASDGLRTNTAINAVPLDEILNGGPGKDGIPALTDPAFVSVSEAKKYLSPDKKGIKITVGNTTRFYPFNIMVWHEVVNDTIEGKHLVITFCPLCGSAIVFDAAVDGKPEAFGVSGKLFESNLLMYDKTTESLWSQIQKKAVVGDKTGTELTLYPAQVITFGELMTHYPAAQVLSKETGYNRDYSLYPYGDYDTNGEIYFPITVHDNRLPAKEIMYAVTYGTHALAFRLSDLSDKPAKLVVGNSTITARKMNGEVEVRDEKGTLIPGFYTMWFAWAIYHQNDGIVWTAARKPNTPQEVSFTAPDGYQLKGTLWPSQKPTAPAIILVHQYGSNRHDFDSLVPFLLKEGYAVLAYDIRGFGESQSGPANINDFPKDVGGAIQFLKSRNDIHPAQFAVIGASVGANVAYVASGSIADISAAVSLSPSNTGSRGVLLGHDIGGFRPHSILIASDDREKADADFIFNTAHDPKEEKEYPGYGHGIALLQSAQARADILAFLKKILRYNY